MNEQKIREAFEKYCEANPFKDSFSESDFSAGYLALLNELIPQGEWNTFPRTQWILLMPICLG